MPITSRMRTTTRDPPGSFNGPSGKRCSAPGANDRRFSQPTAALANSQAIELTGDHDVFGDGTVIIKSTPGHTPGHQSLFVKLPVSGGVVLTGDLYHYAAERTLKKIPNNDNQELTRASRAAIDEFLQKTGAQLWIQHDIGANASLKKAPQYYD